MIKKTDYLLDKMSIEDTDATWKAVKSVYVHHFNMPFADNYLRKKCEGAHFARLRVLWDDKQAVGIFLLFGYKVKVNNQKTIVYRASAAVDSAYRSKNNLTSFMYKNIIPQIIKYSFYRQYVIESFIHPSSFSVAQKNLARVYPSPDYATPQKINALIKAVHHSNILTGHTFEHDNPYLGRYPVNTQQSTTEAARWQEKINKDTYIRFYHQQGAMQNNNTLICIVPATVKNLVLSLLKTRKNKTKYSAEKKKQRLASVTMN